MGVVSLMRIWHGVFDVVGVMICIGVAMLSFIRIRRGVAYFYLFLLTLATVVWNFFEGLSFLPSSLPINYQSEYLLYIGVSFGGVLFFCLCFAYVFPGKIISLQKNKLLYVLYIVPAITTACVIFPPLRRFFLTVTFFPESAGGYYYSETYHFWFHIHTVVSYAGVLFGSGLLVYRSIYPSSENRSWCIIATVSMTLYIGWNIYGTFASSVYLTVSSLVRTGLIVVLYSMLYFDTYELIVSQAVRNLYALLPLPIYVVDRYNNIVFANDSGLQLCGSEESAPSIRGKNYIQLMDEFKVLRSYNANMGKYVVRLQKADELYYIERSVIRRKHKDKIGYLFLLIPSTVYAAMFRDLEKKAYFDALTGCFNRMRLKLLEGERKFTLPLSFVMCDVDGLKNVNDTFGHDEGDAYLLRCVGIIRSCIRESDLLFRLGGDEFLILLPNTAVPQVERIVQKIADSAKVSSEAKYPTSISVGYEIVTKEPIDFQKAISVADEKMYREKKARRRIRR